MKPKIIFFLLTAWLLCYPAALSDEGWLVTRVEADSCRINAGPSSNLKPGDLLNVWRVGELVGQVQVVEVTKFYTTVKPVMVKVMEEIEIGDIANQKGLENYRVPPTPGASPTPDKTPSAAQAQAMIAAQSAGLTNPAPEASPAKTAPPYKKGEFEKAFGKNTKSFLFKTDSSDKGIKISSSDLLNLATGVETITSGVLYFNPWVGADYALAMYNNYIYSQDRKRQSCSRLTVTYWNNDLVTAYSRFYANKETITDQKKIDAITNNFAQERGIKDFYTFEIEIANQGPGLLQLAPFKWHAYLLDPQGNRIKADSYDETLDKALNPKSSTRGFVYFPRGNPRGKHLTEDNKLILLLEDISGKSTQLEW